MSKKEDSSKYRSRVFCLLLYPDDPSHVSAFDKICKGYDYAAILHNRDKWTAEDEKENPDHKEGVLKKEHWHVVLRFNNAVWNTALAKELGITINYIENVKRSLEAALQYLIHYNDTDKTQYLLDEVKGNLSRRLVESINKIEKSEGEKISELIDIIGKTNKHIDTLEFGRWCADNGYWAEFRRSYSFFRDVIKEHNLKQSGNDYARILKDMRNEGKSL